MLSTAMLKLQEALEIIDDLGAHLPGIHVATAIGALEDLIKEGEDLSRSDEPVRAASFG